MEYFAPDTIGGLAYFAPDAAPAANSGTGGTGDGTGTGTGTGTTPSNPTPVIVSTVTGITVLPASATLADNGTLQLTATVLGTNIPSQAVLWSIDVGSITPAGLAAVTALVDEAQIVTVTATSVQDGTVAGYATIAVPIKPNARNYDWLRAKVTRWLRRSDLADDIPDFIMLAERRISSDLEARLQNTVATLQTKSGVAAVRVPADFNNMRSLSIPVYGKLDYMTPETLESRYAGNPRGVPRNYTIERSQIKLGPTPDAVYAIKCVYQAEIPALADAPNGLNWLVIDHPEIYLAATLSEGFTAIRDQANMQIWEGKYRAAVTSLNNNDWNSGGTLSVRADSYTP